ncbi:unnamed protein product [Camellia sinensis]
MVMGMSSTWGKGETNNNNKNNGNYDYSFKVLLIGDSGVGKSSLLLSFISNSNKDLQDLSPTIIFSISNAELMYTQSCISLICNIKQDSRFQGALALVSVAICFLIVCGFQDQAANSWWKKTETYDLGHSSGQERFGTLISSYYRGAHGIILVYDVTRRETFTNLSEIWAKEVELYSTNQDCVKILVGNKVDKEGERAVSREEGMALAQEHKSLFLECSAKKRENVQQCFKELTLKILDIPSLLEKGSAVVRRQILKQKHRGGQVSRSGNCCS